MLKEFFGVDGFAREPEGYLSWQHLTFVSALMAVMVFMAVLLAVRNRNKSIREKNRVLIAAAVLMDSTELIKILLKCALLNDWMSWLNDLPLFLCSIQFITLPAAAFCRGRLRDASLDFAAMFGLLGAVLGTYCAANNYGCYPVISFINVFSGITHSVAGFASLYIILTGMATMDRRNMPVSLAIIFGFSLAAYVANLLLNTNYMFLTAGDGTPYDILFSLTGGSPVLYPAGVVLLFIVYIALAYLVCHLVHRRRSRAACRQTEEPA